MVDLPHVLEQRACRPKGSTHVAILMGDQDHAAEWLRSNGEGHDLEDHAPLRSGERGGTAGPQHDFRLGEKPEAGEQRAKWFLEAVVAARQHESTAPPSTRRAGARTGDERSDEVCNDVVLCARSLQGAVPSDAVDVPSPLSPPLQVSGSDQVADDRLDGPRCDTDLVCDLAKTQIRATREGDEDVSVVREERPGPAHSGPI
jgi:hypothetical protein